MRLKASFVLALLLVISGGVLADHHEGVSFTVTIENISGTGLLENAGVAAVPVGGDSAGPALPGGAYEFVIRAQAGDRLTCATMLAQSNDLFFAPDEAGIALFDAEGDQQAPRQSEPNTGDDEMGAVQPVSALDDGLAYPAANDIVAVHLTPGEMGQFTVRIENVSGDSTVPTPITPVFWVVESQDTDMEMGMKYGVLFTSGYEIYGNGLEHLAEDGDPSALVAFYGIDGFATPIAPVIWVVHGDSMGAGVFFTSGEPDRGQGLESLAEDGSPAALAESLMDMNHGVQAVPDGADVPGPAFPGDSYSFRFTAAPGDHLSFAAMFVQSNDLFFAPDENGIPLFGGMGAPIALDRTGLVDLWDAGTEVNQEPGLGGDQAPRQSGPNTGADEMGVVQRVADSGDGFRYSRVATLIRVTVSVDDM
ncbi:MAG: spondin domain-containing protein [Chloroflexota bacterium]|nr:spondin domain-containing protein [Chloroflexota bacterium]